eukprot:6213-Eustigmatos_ZCMA.PRE.1
MAPQQQPSRQAQMGSTPLGQFLSLRATHHHSVVLYGLAATSYEQQPRPQDEQQPQPGWDDVVAKTVSNATSGDVGLDFAE